MTVEMEPRNVDKDCVLMRGWLCLKGFARQATQIAKDDPRRLIHSIKVGLAITIVSFLYYFQPLYSSFGVSAMWAVITVVVVFEFYAGATVGKGLNRGLATLAAGGLGLGAHYVAGLTGRINEQILTGLFIFILAVTSTYLRFFPKIKARYDYGMTMFILTFCLVSMSGLRTNDILNLAINRLSTILVGAFACVTVSICICPVWAGEDLHMLVAQNLEELGSFLEGFAEECLRRSEGGEDGGPSQTGLNRILDSKSNEETLENFARWEPSHGRFMCRHPWKQYLKIGNRTRQCACRIESLKNVVAARTQAPKEIEETFWSMSLKSGTALKGLAWDIRTMTMPAASPNPYIEHLKAEEKKLKSLLKKGLQVEEKEKEKDVDLQVIIRMATTASLLMDTAAGVETIAEEVKKLSLEAKFEGAVELSTRKEMNDNKGVEEVGVRVHVDALGVGTTTTTRVDDV